MPYVKCKICNKELYVKPSHQKHGWGKYCSIKCRHIGQRTGKKVECYVCSKEIWRTKSQLRKSKSKKSFCSKRCQTLWRNKYYSGKKHPNWKGGHCLEYRKIMLQSKIVPKCQICGEKNVKVLLVHHKDYNRKNHQIKNLVWLCWNCHHLVHCYNHQIPK